MTSRATVVAATDYSDLDFLVFTQSGPFPDVKGVMFLKVSLTPHYSYSNGP